MDYTKFTPLLIGVVKELKAENDSLRAELGGARESDAAALADLRREIDALKAAR